MPQPGDGRLSPVRPGRLSCLGMSRVSRWGWTGFTSPGGCRGPRQNRDRHYTAEQPGVWLPQPEKAEPTHSITQRQNTQVVFWVIWVFFIKPQTGRRKLELYSGPDLKPEARRRRKRVGHGRLYAPLAPRRRGFSSAESNDLVSEGFAPSHPQIYRGPKCRLSEMGGMQSPAPGELTRCPPVLCRQWPECVETRRSRCALLVTRSACN